MSGHTPGPWTVATSFRGIYSQHPAPGPVQVCRAPDHFHAQWDLNAPLIAAAPDLLSALDLIAGIAEGSQTLNSLPHIASLARAAIKATGYGP